MTGVRHAMNGVNPAFVSRVAMMLDQNHVARRNAADICCWPGHVLIIKLYVADCVMFLRNRVSSCSLP